MVLPGRRRIADGGWDACDFGPRNRGSESGRGESEPGKDRAGLGVLPGCYACGRVYRRGVSAGDRPTADVHSAGAAVVNLNEFAVVGAVIVVNKFVNDDGNLLGYRNL